eukprot:1146719-Pelagomonas_calceolata.AAC.3
MRSWGHNVRMRWRVAVTRKVTGKAEKLCKSEGYVRRAEGYRDYPTYSWCRLISKYSRILATKEDAQQSRLLATPVRAP